MDIGLRGVYKAPRRSQDLYRQLEFESVSEMLTAAQIIVRIDDHPFILATYLDSIMHRGCRP